MPLKVDELMNGLADLHVSRKIHAELETETPHFPSRIRSFHERLKIHLNVKYPQTVVRESIANKGQKGLFAATDFEKGDVLGFINCHGVQTVCKYENDEGVQKTVYEIDLFHPPDVESPESSSERLEILKADRWTIFEDEENHPTCIFSFSTAEFIDEHTLFNAQFAQDGAQLSLERHVITQSQVLDVVKDMHNAYVLRVFGDPHIGMMCLPLVASRYVSKGSEILASHLYHKQYLLCELIIAKYDHRIHQRQIQIPNVIQSLDHINVGCEEDIQLLVTNGTMAMFAEDEWTILFHKLFEKVCLGSEFESSRTSDPKKWNDVVRAILTTPNFDPTWRGILIKKVKEFKTNS